MSKSMLQVIRSTMSNPFPDATNPNTRVNALYQIQNLEKEDPAIYFGIKTWHPDGKDGWKSATGDFSFYHENTEAMEIQPVGDEDMVKSLKRVCNAYDKQQRTNTDLGHIKQAFYTTKEEDNEQES